MWLLHIFMVAESYTLCLSYCGQILQYHILLQDYFTYSTCALILVS